MHVLRDQWGARSISQVDAAVPQEAVDREPFQQIDAITSRSQSPTSATRHLADKPTAPAFVRYWAGAALLTIALNCAKLIVCRSAQLMPGHKFNIGDIVELERSLLRRASGGVYEVTKRLPKR